MKDGLYAALILGLILPLIIGVIYCLKRIQARPLRQGASHSMTITQQLAIGSKERLICVEVNGTHLVLGVTPHVISALHVFTNKSSTKDLS